MASDNLSQGLGKVAVHRWFQDGEGWAFHPWFQDHFQELLASCNQLLRNRPHPDQVKGAQAEAPWSHNDRYCLLVDHSPDPDCPDSRAVSRSPSIFRAVLVSASISETEKARYREKLAHIQALRPGPDLSLELKPVQKKAEPSSKRLLFGVVAILALVAMILFATSPWSKRSSGGSAGTDAASATQQMTILLKNWGQSVENENNRQQVINQFFKFLSPPKTEDSLKEKKHLDYVFAKRFPQLSIETENSANDDRKLSKALRTAYECLKADEVISTEGEPAEDTNAALVTLVKAIGKQADYQKWWEERKKQRWCTGGVEKAKPETRAFVRKFAKPGVYADLEDSATTMVKMLKKWKVKEIEEKDAEARPQFVAECFFSVLSLWHLEREDESHWKKTKDGYHRYIAFLLRLPKEPLWPDGDAKVDDQLWELAKRLRAGNDPTTQIPGDLLDEIEKKMQYSGDWTPGRKINDNADPVPKHIEDFVKRFQKNDR